jgi:alpha-L-fucosidase 2
MKLPKVSLLFMAAALAADAQPQSQGPNLIVPGRIRSAMNFDGAHYVRPPGLGTLEKGTLSVWVRPEKNPEQIITLLNTDHWQRSACHFQLFEGLAQFSVAEAMEIRSETRPGLQYGEWQQLTATYDSPAKTAALYVNGRLERKTTLERGVPLDFRNFSVGAWNHGERLYLGLMDDLRIYDRVLDAADISALAQGKDTAAKPLTWWTFDAIHNRKIADASGHAHDAKVMGVPAYQGPEVARVAADMGIPDLRKGFVSERPAEDWTKALVTGNGVMGALVHGDPLNETITLNRANLWLPLNQPLPPVDTASHLREIRGLLSQGEYQKAADYVVKLSHDEGYQWKRWTDPYVPAFDLQIEMPSAGEARSYLRGVDFSTGVAAVRWEDDRGRFLRRTFISRPDNIAVLSITGPGKGKVSCTLELAQTPGAWGVKEFKTTAEGHWLTYRTGFANRWPGSLQGCEGVSRVIVRKGSSQTDGARLVIRDADEVLVLTRVELTYDYATPAVEGLKLAVGRIDADYATLLRRHAKVQGEVLNRVRLDLGGAQADHALSSEALQARSAVGRLPAALVEKEFDAARYATYSSSGELPPPLQGIWTGTWNPPWSGDFTQNGNLQCAIAAENSGAMPEAMRALFSYMDRQMADYRTNAMRLFGARGIHVPSRTSSHGLNNHFDQVWPMTFWTAGAGWNAHFYYDYYLYTGDQAFLRKQALPFMLDAAAFYEDFLVEGPDGRFLFSPSYSPENNPGNNPSQSCLNATMDLSVARELLHNLVAVCTEQKLYPEKVQRWKAMLAKMPGYLTNKDGALKEWATPALEDNYAHRHCSHLYALFDGMPKEIEDNPGLQQAFKRAADRRMEIRKQEGGGVMAFGLVQLGLALSSLRDAEASYEVVDWLANRFWQRNMVTTHDPKTIFNVDLCGGFPAIIIKMLLASQPGTIELLPALPKEWPTGRIQGLPTRCQVRVLGLEWKPGVVSVTLESAQAQTIALKLPMGMQSISVAQRKAKITRSDRGDQYREITVPSGKAVRLVKPGKE